MKLPKHLSTTSLPIAMCIAIGAGPAAAAVSLGDGSYDIQFSVVEAGADFAGSTSAVGMLDDLAFGELVDDPRTIGFTALLSADLTLRLSIEPLGASAFSYPLVGTFALTGLDLVVDGLPADITGVSFDAARTNIRQYQDAGDFIAPTIAYTGTSATISFGYEGSGIAGDQPWVYFDITTAVPEPDGWVMLVAGMPLFAWLARRRRAPSAATAATARP